MAFLVFPQRSRRAIDVVLALRGHLLEEAALPARRGYRDALEYRVADLAEVRGDIARDLRVAVLAGERDDPRLELDGRVAMILQPLPGLLERTRAVALLEVELGDHLILDRDTRQHGMNPLHLGGDH